MFVEYAREFTMERTDSSSVGETGDVLDLGAKVF